MEYLPVIIVLLCIILLPVTLSFLTQGYFRLGQSIRIFFDKKSKSISLLNQGINMASHGSYEEALNCFNQSLKYNRRVYAIISDSLVR